MRPCSSTLLTRLALALLVALGFVAPVATVEADRVVQTVAAKPPPSVEAPAMTARAWASRPRDTLAPSQRVQVAQAPQIVSLRYLLNRAWLL